MKKLMMTLAMMMMVAVSVMAEGKVRTNTGSDVIQRVIYEDPRGDFGVVLRVDTSTFGDEYTEDDMKEIIKNCKAAALAGGLDGWYTKWAVGHATDSSKWTPSYKWDDKDKIVDAMNGSAIDQIFNMIPLKLLDEGQKLLDAGYPVVTLSIVKDGFKDDPPTAILHMYKNGYLIGFWLHNPLIF